MGGYMLEYLVRLGIYNISVCDADCFELSNINRQLLCTTETLGCIKTQAAAARAKCINPDVSVTAYDVNINSQNAAQLLSGSDIAIDALDNIPDRIALEHACEALRIPLVSAAVDRWLAQCAVVFPGDRLLESLYPQGDSPTAAGSSGVLSFVPAVAAGLAVAQAVKLMTGKPVKRGTVILLDTLNNTYDNMKLL